MTCLDLRMFMLSVEFRCNTRVPLGYGLVLGMEWLSGKGAILGFERRVVRLLTCLSNTLEVS